MRVRRLATAAAALLLAASAPACGADESASDAAAPEASSGSSEESASGAPPSPGARAEAVLRDPDGARVGSATLLASPNGVLLRAELTGLPPGEHAFHLHETGRCEAPEFASAGGHLNPADTGHGFLDGDGVHAGDLPNLHVPESGTLRLDVLAPGVELEAQLLDGDGAALMVHRGPDDYRTNPAGAAGPRIACGAIERR